MHGVQSRGAHSWKCARYIAIYDPMEEVLCALCMEIPSGYMCQLSDDPYCEAP